MPDVVGSLIPAITRSSSVAASTRLAADAGAAGAAAGETAPEEAQGKQSIETLTEDMAEGWQDKLRNAFNFGG